VPLVVLTADRPPELRDRGAPQTIDQGRIFGGYVRWFAEVPLLDGAAETARHVRSIVGRAVATAGGPPAGPVHLNVPFREPLVPDAPLVPEAEPEPRHARAFSEVVAGPAVLPPDELDALAARLGAVERGLIVAGPQDDPRLAAALARLAGASGFPIAADPLSGARCGPHDRRQVLAHADHLVRPGPWIDRHRPELVLRFGAMPTSKPMLTLIAAGSAAQIVVDGDRTWSEPAIVPTTFVQADATTTADALADVLVDLPARWGTTSAWADEWCQADRVVDDALREWLAGVTDRDEAFEGLPFAILGRTLPDGALLWAGNSMPVRDLDDWLPTSDRAIRPLSNRGANGIDGVVSTALGAAAAGVGPVVLVVGDLSFLHDLNALVAAKLHDLSATIVLVDNDGGGIFSFLPQASADRPEVGLPEHYEELFGTPHGIDVAPIVGALGGEPLSVGARDLREALVESVGRPGVRVLRLRTERRRNLELHREAAAVVSAALVALVPSR
jgi:2-succinyl-5-enolpyruvyl-6-hydroxy-3-cyclohexene-1-carboxylate synthase